uniref:Aftiphilin clathrin-binding box domain-containing protein n=1 Tax=Canis lupus familiaris TaxID=9615 RepID=A0A8C0MGC4_CANLF
MERRPRTHHSWHTGRQGLLGPPPPTLLRPWSSVRMSSLSFPTGRRAGVLSGTHLPAAPAAAGRTRLTKAQGGGEAQPKMTFTPPPCCRLLPRTLWAGGGTPEPCLVGRPGQHLPDITALGLRFGHSSRCRSQKARPRPRCKALPHCSKTQRPCLQNGDTSLCHWTTQGKLPARTLETLATRAGTWPLRPASAVGGRAHSRSQLALSYADVFRFAFQEVLVPQAAEGISPLDHVLDASGEGKPGCEPVHTLCSESRELWRALQNTNGMSASRCLWSKSRCQENFFLVLGIDAAQKDLSGDLGHIPECSDLKEPEEAGAPSRLQPCRALIQTKLSGPSGGGQGSLLACSLFLRTPLRRSGQYVPIPWKKKIFNPRNLKITLFNSDVC